MYGNEQNLWRVKLLRCGRATFCYLEAATSKNFQRHVMLFYNHSCIRDFMP